MNNRSFIYFLFIPLFVVILLCQKQSEQTNFYSAAEYIEQNCNLLDWADEDPCLTHFVNRGKKGQAGITSVKSLISSFSLFRLKPSEFSDFCRTITPLRAILCIYRI